MSRAKRSTHREYAQRIAFTGDARCPDCDKIRFLSKAAAKKAIRRIKSREGRLNAYRCGEFWHIGHPPKALLHGVIDRREIPTKTAEERAS